MRGGRTAAPTGDPTNDGGRVMRWMGVIAGLAAVLAATATGAAAAEPAPAAAPTQAEEEAPPKPTPEYMMPWERAKAEAEKKKAAALASGDAAVEERDVVMGEMTIIKLPVPGKTVISTHPEVAEIYLEQPNLLFIFGRFEGTTHVVIGDAKLNPVWTASVNVIHPDKAR